MSSADQVTIEIDSDCETLLFQHNDSLGVSDDVVVVREVVERCPSCLQDLEKVVYPKYPLIEPGVRFVYERQLVNLYGNDVTQPFDARDVSFQDDYTHFVPLDFTLQKSPLFFNALVHLKDFQTLKRPKLIKAGPVIGWTISGLHFGEDLKILFMTDCAQYAIHNSNTDPGYSPFFKEFLSKCRLLKMICEIFDDVLLNDDIATFSLKNLGDKLSSVDSSFSQKLVKSAEFILDQLSKAYSRDQFLSSLAVQQIFRLTQSSPNEDRNLFHHCFTFPSTSQGQKSFRFPPASRAHFDQAQSQTSQTHAHATHSGRKSRPEKGETGFDSKATTTPLVSKFFSQFFQDQIRLPVNEKKTDEVIEINSDEDIISLSHRADKNIRWPDMPMMHYGCTNFYGSVLIQKVHISLQDFVLVKKGNFSFIGKIAGLYQTDVGSRMTHVSKYLFGKDTVLGDSSDPCEVFATTSCEEVTLSDIDKKVRVVNFKVSKSNWKKDGGTEEALVTPSTTNSNIYWFRLQYCEITCRFETVLPEVLKPLGPEAGHCKLCQFRETQESAKLPRLDGENRLLIGGITFEPNDAVFLSLDSFPVHSPIKKGYKQDTHPDLGTVDERRYPEFYRYSEISNKSKLKGNYSSIKDPFHVGIIRKILRQNDGKLFVKIRRMARPENTSFSNLEVAHANLNLLFWTEETSCVEASKIQGKCVILPLSKVPNFNPVIWAKNGKNRFYYKSSYCAQTKTFRDITPETEAGRYLPPEESLFESQLPAIAGLQLRTLDLFSGSGGLSKGLEMSGCAKIEWAIENDKMAANSFKLNHPEATLIIEDANAVLHVVMDGQSQNDGYPKKGEIEMICSGPPCQGFSGMNRARDGASALFNNSKIAVCLSYLDYYRPKFFLMENVRSMFSHKSGHLLKLIIRTIVAMGYQITVGVLQSGNHGVAQDRLRAFVLATSPGFPLPFFPEPETVFVRSQSDLNIDGKCWSRNIHWKSSAPFRNITAREVLSDLPRIKNGSNIETMAYAKNPETHFQKLSRLTEDGRYMRQVDDHICKEVSILVQARISLIPTRPGADWRDLPNIIWQFPDGSKTEKLKYIYNDGTAKDISSYKGVCPCMVGPKIPCKKSQENQKNTIIPWAMVHTARRNNHWAGCYGRVALQSFFSTIDTDPDPHGKQGRVLHPDAMQKRVFSVRELARAQGMPDSFKFFGHIKDKFRQVGNAVPPPLAAAIGQEIRKAMAKK